MCFALSKNKSLGLTVSSIIFALVAIVHVVRLLTNFSVTVNGQEIPLLVNVIGLAVTGFMSYWLWTLRSSDN